MANTTIAIKKSATGSAVPSSLAFGELAINYADGKLYYKNVNSSIVEFSPSINSFGIVNANSTLVIAGGPGAILTFISGNNTSIVGDAINDTVTFSANLLPAFVIANASFDKANTVETTAIAAFNKANTTGATILEDEVNATRYVTFVDSISGTQTKANVNSTKLTFNPSAGTLSATNFDSLSDFNKKTDIETINNAIESVIMLRGVTFNWKENGLKSMGLIAQELEEIIPEVVMTNDRGEKSVTYGSLIGLLVESIKDLKKELEEIKSILNR